MNAFIAFASLICAASAGIIAPATPYATTVTDAGYGPSTIVRAPEHDSASIEHHRFGGNFAYSTAEAHAFAQITPKLQTLTHPVAETINTHIPEVIETRQPAPILRETHVAHPIHQDFPVHADQPIIGPVAARTTVHQPVYKTQQIAHTAYETPVLAEVRAPIHAPVVAKTQTYAHAAVAPVAAVAAPAAIGYANTGLVADAGLATGYAGLATGYAANGLIANNGIIANAGLVNGIAANGIIA